MGRIVNHCWLAQAGAVDGTTRRIMHWWWEGRVGYEHRIAISIEQDPRSERLAERRAEFELLFASRFA